MSFSFKNSLVIDNNVYLKWLDSTNTSRSNIIALNSSDDIHINSIQNKKLFLNSNSANSSTFVNVSNGNNTVFGSKIGVGLLTDSNISANISIVNNGYIGLANSAGSNTGYLGLSGSHTLSTAGSRIMLYGVNSLTSDAGKLNMYTGNNTYGSVNIYTGQESLRMQIQPTGTCVFTPNGIDASVTIYDTSVSISKQVSITDTAQSVNGSTGALIVSGGVTIAKDCRINGTLVINSTSGNISFDSTRPSTSYTSGAIYISGGLGISNTTVCVSVTSGGGISCAGGVAIAKNMIIGGGVVILDSTDSSNSQDGSIVVNGGIGANGVLNIRSDASPQIRLAPSTNGGETMLKFFSRNDFTSSSAASQVSWNMGQGAGGIGTGCFGLYRFPTIGSSNTLTISSAGNIGINTNSPNYSLDITGTLFVSSNTLFASTTQSTGVGTGGSMTVRGGASVTKDLYVGGTVTSSSDARLKRDITPLDGGYLDKISTITPVKYIAKNDPESNTQYGFIAQDFEQEFPELIKRAGGDESMYSLDYQKVSVVLLKCIKELQARIEKLEKT
jgi:hypothetical protein